MRWLGSGLGLGLGLVFVVHLADALRRHPPCERRERGRGGVAWRGVACDVAWRGVAWRGVARHLDELSRLAGRARHLAQAQHALVRVRVRVSVSVRVRVRARVRVKGEW